MIPALIAVFLWTSPARAAEPSKKDACEKQGGKIKTVGMMHFETCILPYPDAGKKCRDAKQCKGGCVYTPPKGKKEPKPGTKAAGRCKADNDLGCFTWVKNGVIGDTTCAD